MKLWLAFERPTSGVAYVNGTDSWADPERAVQSLSYIPQQPALHRSLSVSDHLRLCASLRPSFDVAGARERLDALGIPLKSKATRLSGGQQAQVGLALALGARAPILLLDEPLASLDPLPKAFDGGAESMAIIADEDMPGPSWCSWALFRIAECMGPSRGPGAPS